MALSKKLLAAGLAAFSLMATAGAAFAAPAYVTGNINVRSGPGTGYSVIDTVRRGQRVDVEYCRGSWCYVEKRGPDGWVSARYLERGGRPGWNDDDDDYRPRHPRRPRWDDDDWGYPRYPYSNGPSSQVCVDGPNSYFCVGN
ncbi:MAG TPA: SH3 domain-containing protein [Devosia sp.]|jgi:hypothetical protein